MSRAVMLAASFILATAARADDKGALVREWNAPFARFRIVDNLYYVGTAELASYLLATPEGSILVDSGVEESGEQIVAGIRALGFKPENVKWIVNSQAHFDHAAGFAALKKRTGARLAASAADAPLLERGGRELHVVIAGSTSVNEGVKVLDNPKYPEMLRDFEKTFAVFHGLDCDVFLGQHAGFFGLKEKFERRRNGGANPFVDTEACRSALAGAETRFREHLAGERAAK